MSLQTIIDNAVNITIKRNKLSGQTVSRSGQIKFARVANNIPWQMTVEMHPGLTYSTSRGIVEELDRIDRSEESEINIGSTNTGLSYITAYQGQLGTADLANITVDSVNASNIVLDVSSVVTTSTTVVFEPGDYIQLDTGYRYPYTVTSQVTRGIGTTITVPINRPFIPQASYTPAGKGILVGSAVSWRVVLTRRPTYTITPYNRLVFDGAFEMFEVIQ